MILIIDNYDSFVYNLVQRIGQFKKNVIVYRNDKISVNQIRKLKPTHIVISPGPCTPNEAGISVEVIKKLGKTIPLLGVCLGHECIGAAFGATIIKAPYPIHGKVSKIKHDNKTIYKNVPNNFIATRYHSLIIDHTSIPECLEISAKTNTIVMGIRHKKYPIEGIQFHPESFLTNVGLKILKNFLSIIKQNETNKNPCT